MCPPPFRRPRSPYWWVKITHGGRTVRRSTGTADLGEAQRLEAEWRRPVSGHPFADVCAEYLAARFSERAAIAVEKLRPFFGSQAIEAITPADIARYHRERGVSEATRIRELGVLRAAIRHCRTQLGWNVPDPVSGRMPKSPPHRIRWLTKAEYRKLRDAARKSRQAPWLESFIVLAVNTGLRRGELLGLEWRRVDLDNRAIYLDPGHQKGRRSSVVPINDSAKIVFDDIKRSAWRDKRYVFPHPSIRTAFENAALMAGLPGVRVHDLRHTCAAWLVQAGVPLRTVAEILRHRDVRTTMRYAHLAPDDARAGLAKLDE